MGKENQLETTDNDCSPVKTEELTVEARYSTDSRLPTCRVCHSAESDRRGDSALRFLEITPPPPTVPPQSRKRNAEETADDVETSSPDDIETGIHQKHRDELFQLGCSCKNELALVHYACALKWFLNHGSTVCEICGNAAENVETADFNKVITALREYTNADEVRKQRLSEISSWFGPYSLNNNQSSSVTNSQVMPEQVVTFDIMPMENRATKWAVEGTGILFATGLLTVTLVWLIAPRVGKNTARSGLHILLGGLCALTIVIFFRFVVLTRIRYGPARYWAILFIFWFLVFGIWASRSRSNT